MERLYGFEVKPYLLSAETSNAWYCDIEEQLNNEKTSVPANGREALDEPDYTIEKYIFYEEFVKKMQILDIVYTACTMPQEFPEVGSKASFYMSRNCW